MIKNQCILHHHYNSTAFRELVKLESTTVEIQLESEEKKKVTYMLNIVLSRII